MIRIQKNIIAMNKKIISLLLGIFMSLSFNMQAQSLSLDFGHFAGQEWTMIAFHGEGQDTIATGALDASGKATIMLPNRYKDYRGMTRWLLAKGGGLDIIFSGTSENISVSCTEAQPSADNIIYRGSLENTYLNQRYVWQQRIVKKTEAMSMSVQAYNDDQELLPILEKELKKQEQVYNLLQEETENNPLYAARFAQIVNVSRGLPPILSGDMSKADSLLIDFIINKLDMSSLFTSGYWGSILGQWLQWYVYNPEHEILFIDDFQVLKKRIADPQIQVAFEQSVRKLLYAMERSNLALLTEQRQAPALTQGKLPKKKTILVFYESGCGNCTVQMKNLVDLYTVLEKKGYTVISIAADSDEETYIRAANAFPWKDKYCDYQGFAGKNFINYGVMGTPTFYGIDEKGIIWGMYNRLEDMKLD